ncbi:MAG: HAMP domain-containing histidine kinase [Muribaculaceae bacterium]|nr:HAMP domain-containing histidine kinase [Muribaculaceae bacterium]
MKLKNLLILILFLTAVIPVTAAGDINLNLNKELQAKVKEARNPEDSIIALYNLFDITPRKKQAPILENIYNLAQRTDDVNIQLDVIRQLSNIYTSNDSVLQVLYAAAKELPTSVSQHQTLMYLRINRILTNSITASEAERQVRLREILHEYTNKKHYSTDERILLLFSLCAYLSNTAEGELLVKYTDELENLINNAPNTIAPIRNQFYAYAGTLFTNIGNHERAVKAMRQLLDETDKLQKQYEEQGRVYRKFNRQRYDMYRRMLINYPALTLAEVDSIYDVALAITKIDSDTRDQFNAYHLCNIAQLMAHEQYEKAAPLIVDAYPKIPGNSTYKKFLLAQLNKASEHINDKDMQLFAAREYNKYLQEEIKFKSEERLRELQVIYDLQNIREANQALEIRNQQTRLEAHETIITISIVALIIVILITIVTFMMYLRAKQMSVSALHANKSLEHERTVSRRHYEDLMRSRNELNKANLQKSDLINSLGHEMRTPLTAISDFTKLIVDSVDDHHEPYLRNFAHIISHNVELLETISRDILDISLLDGDEITVSRRLVSVNELCEMVVETLRPTTHSGVAMQFVKPENSASIITDPQRVEQILINLLKNAVRFTRTGEITLTYTTDRYKGKIRFEVTDTGCGISEEQQKTLFTRVKKGEPHTGKGIGLYLCQIIARRLDGTIALDPTYTEGARFILTLPL